jgi:hypothetical protein
MPYTVYVGDTSSELEKLRPIVMDQIAQAGMLAVEIDAADRKKADINAIVRRKMTAADYVISIVTYKRAWEPAGENGKSLAEIEFDLAHELGKPLAVLLPDDKSEMGMFLRLRSLVQSPVEMHQQQQFWKQVSQDASTTSFADEADLVRQLNQILSSWAAREANDTATLNPGTLQAVPAETQPAAPLLPSSQREFFPATSTDIDALAEKVAARVDAIQQKRAQDLAEQAVKVNEALRLLPGELVFGRPSSSKQFQSDVFMIMPFAASFSGIFQDIVKPLLKDLKLTVTRGDEFNSTNGVIIEEVWSALNACRFVIAEISGGNDNVFYELGIAHTLNKPAILITQSKTAEEIPFDVRHLRYIRYENTAGGVAKLGEDLRAAITRLVGDLEDGWDTGTG